MNEALLILHIDCWLPTGSATLLPKLTNPPISNSVMASQTTHFLKPGGHIKASDPHCNRYQRTRRAIDSLNPHSAVATTAPMSPPPRGFLP